MFNIIKKYDVIKYLYLNYFCKNIIRKKNYKIYPEKNSIIQLSKECIIFLNANLYFNTNKYKNSKAESYLILNGKSELQINGNVKIRFNSTIQINDNAKAVFGSFTCNANLNLQCNKSIVIGDDCMIGRNVTIYDSSFHPTGFSKSKIKITYNPVKIGNHVWVGSNCFIMPGSDIKDCCILGAVCCTSGEYVKNSVVIREFDKPRFRNMYWGRSENDLKKIDIYY